MSQERISSRWEEGNNKSLLKEQQSLFIKKFPLALPFLCALNKAVGMMGNEFD